MRKVAAVLLLAWFSSASTGPPCDAAESETLLGRMSRWQYPGSAASGATMRDTPTVDQRGERTMPSIQCHAVFTTPDPADKVVEYYRSKLDRKPEDSEQPLPGTDSSRSVTYHRDSENRPVTIEIISVNTDDRSTTLVVSRAENESKTHIAWTQYTRLLTMP